MASGDLAIFVYPLARDFEITMNPFSYLLGVTLINSDCSGPGNS